MLVPPTSSNIPLLTGIGNIMTTVIALEINCRVVSEIRSRYDRIQLQPDTVHPADIDQLLPVC